MDVHRLPLHNRAVPLLRVLFRGGHEKPAGDGLAHHFQVFGPRGHHLQLVPVHDAEQLLPHILRPPHGARLHKVFVAPRVGKLRLLPRLVHRQKREVVPLGLVEPGFPRVRRGGTLLGAIKHVFHGQHGDHGEHLIGAAEVNAGEEHLCELRLQRELGHFTAEAGEQPLLVQRAEHVQVVERGHQGVRGGRVHEPKVEQVVDPHGFHLQHHAREVGALQLWHRGGQHLPLERPLRVQPVALAGARAPRPARPLPRRRLRNRHDDERVHAGFRVVHFLF